jgi:RHS repeat-associated protein
LTSVVSSDGQRTDFTYDFEGNLIRATDSGPLERVRSFVLDDLTNVAQQNSSDGNSFSTLTGQAVDAHFATFRDSGEVEYALTDAINSTVSTVDETGSLKSQFAYEPFGATSPSGNDFPFQYTGRVPVSSRLYYYRARFYDPQTGRFLSEDPLGFAAGINQYGYVNGDPISLNDPSGQCPWCIGAGIGFGVDLVSQLIENGGNFRCISLTRLATSTALGALGGGLGGRGLTSMMRGLSNSTKGTVGETLSLVENRLAGSTLLNTQTASIPGQRTIVDSTWRSLSGATYYVESKFGTSGLTAAQRAAQRAVGDAYHVERWGYPFFERVGAYAGGAAGAAAGSGTGGGGGGDCGCK